MPSEAEVMWEPSDDRLGRLEAALVGAETAIPCLRCSLRGGRTLPHPRQLRLPRAALLGVGGSKVPPTLSEGSDRESVCSSLGGDSVRGRGRAATLRERARKVRERTALPHSSRSTAGDDPPTSVGSSRHSSAPTDVLSEEGSLRSASPAYYLQQDTPTGVYQPQHDAPTQSYQPQHDPPTRPGQAPQDAPAGRAPQDAPAGRAPQDAPAGRAPQDAPAGRAPQDAPAGRAPQDAPAGRAPQDTPTRPGRAPQDAPAGRAPQDAPAGRAPQDAPAGRAPQDTPTRPGRAPQDAPAGRAPQDAPAGRAPQDAPAGRAPQDTPTRPGRAPQDAPAGRAPQDAPAGRAPQDAPAGRAPQDAPAGRARRRKFVAIDMRSAYVEHQSELLVGIPAGAENSHQFTGGSHYHPRTSGFKLGCDDYQTPDFHPQREPKVHSILDFPGLRQDRTSKEINFMNTAPRKQESMKSIASFISEGPLVSEEPVREEEEEVGGGSQETSGSGCVVVFDHVPEAVSKQDLTDLIQPYGQVDRVSVHPTGLTYTAHVTMREAGGAQWVVDILDGSEALLPAGADGRALSVYLLTQ